jgi:drug/metabolite transporter (DMT)-like permease
MSKYRVWILLILCNLFWAGNYVIGKYVVAEITPLMITFSRWLLASFLLLGIASHFEKPKWKVVIKEWPLLTILGILGIIGYNLALYSALDYTSSTNASLVNALNPGVIVICSTIFLKEKFSKLQGAGIIVSLLGVMVILTGGNIAQVFEMEYNKGDLLMIVAIVTWALYSVLGKKLKNTPPITASGLSALAATIIMAPFVISQGVNFGEISSLAINGILYMTVFPSVLSFIFWNLAIREIGANQTGIFLNLIPVFTAIISWILGNNITIVQISGGVLVFMGVYLATGMLERKIKEYKEKTKEKNMDNIKKVI